MTYFEAERRLDKAIIMTSFFNVGDTIRICHIICWILYWILYRCAALRGTDSWSETHHCSWGEVIWLDRGQAEWDIYRDLITLYCNPIFAPFLYVSHHFLEITEDIDWIFLLELIIVHFKLRLQESPHYLFDSPLLPIPPHQLPCNVRPQDTILKTTIDNSMRPHQAVHDISISSKSPPYSLCQRRDIRRIQTPSSFLRRKLSSHHTQHNITNLILN